MNGPDKFGPWVRLSEENEYAYSSARWRDGESKDRYRVWSDRRVMGWLCQKRFRADWYQYDRGATVLLTRIKDAKKYCYVYTISLRWNEIMREIDCIFISVFSVRNECEWLPCHHLITTASMNINRRGQSPSKNDIFEVDGCSFCIQENKMSQKCI